ncbi:hypothetical protein NDU88_006792 [Pleurodeles waltl]|uniref:Uncharacterized protein n=1 Tax=Pleurodeles waltl TaxID=8319 RepID=A0AAV7RPT6_PLEWA|nr:hypothetical protein NDU88_006792 [Pleurodeles waltl]
MALPLNQTMRKKQEAVKAVASLGRGGVTSPRRSESLSDQDSGPDELSCSSQDTADDLPRFTPGTSDEIIGNTSEDPLVPK